MLKSRSAKAKARVGVVSKETADVIARESKIDRINFNHMREEIIIVGYPILPLAHQLGLGINQPGDHGTIGNFLPKTISCCHVERSAHALHEEVQGLHAAPDGLGARLTVAFPSHKSAG